MGDALAVLDELIDSTPPEGRAALVVGLSARIARLGAGLVPPPAPPPVAVPPVEVGVREAAEFYRLSTTYLYRHRDEFKTQRRGRRLMFVIPGLPRAG